LRKKAPKISCYTLFIGGQVGVNDRPERSVEKPGEGVGAHMTVGPDQLHLAIGLLQMCHRFFRSSDKERRLVVFTE
jgi:hypothetical protein